LLEPLEDRTAPTVLPVTSAADPPGPPVSGTLRYAVSQANNDATNAVSDTIVFNIIQMDSSTITLTQGPLARIIQSLGSLDCRRGVSVE